MRVLASFALVVLLAGCLAEQPAPDEPATGADESAARQVTRDVELGRHTVNTPGPGPHTFTVDVPAGGAQGVRWTLTITGPSATSSVSGHGCSNGGNVNIVVGIGATSTTGGTCDDLAAGPAEFTVNLTDPAVAFTAIISGSVTVPADAA